MPYNDPYLQIAEYSIPMQGLERDVTILQVSDLHIAVSDETSSEEMKAHVCHQIDAWEGVRKDFAIRYGDSLDEVHFLPPEEGLSHYVALANALRPDVLLMTGDMMNEYSDENLRFLQKGLSDVHVPWMYLPGNHEARHQAQLAPLLQNQSGVQTLTVGNCKLIGLDDSEKCIRKFQMEEAIAESEGFVPVLAMHIPVLTESNRKETEIFDPYFLLGTGEVDEDSAIFLDGLQKETCPFRLLLCGHVHGKHVSRFYGDRLQICASSAMVGACNLIRLTKV